MNDQNTLITTVLYTNLCVYYIYCLKIMCKYCIVSLFNGRCLEAP